MRLKPTDFRHFLFHPTGIEQVTLHLTDVDRLAPNLLHLVVRLQTFSRYRDDRDGFSQEGRSRLLEGLRGLEEGKLKSIKVLQLIVNQRLLPGMRGNVEMKGGSRIDRVFTRRMYLEGEGQVKY